MSTKEVAGPSLEILDRLGVNLLKTWWKNESLLWRFEQLLKRWRRTMAEEQEGGDPYLPPDAPRPGAGPYQLIVHGDKGNGARHEYLKALTALIIGVIIGFLSGSQWGEDTQISDLEAAQAKLEGRIDALESRIPR